MSKMTGNSVIVNFLLVFGFASASSSCKSTQNIIFGEEHETSSVANTSSNVGSDLSGIWLTNVDSDVLYTKASIENAVQKSKDFGLNSVYPVVWNKEEIFLKSKVVEKYLGKQFISAPQNMDVLGEVTRSAKNKGMTVYAWYENGLKVPIKHDGGDFFKLGQVFANKGWLTKNKAGEIHTTCKFKVCKGFLNPANKEVRTFLVDFFEEIASYDGVEGVMIDDHFSMAPEFGHDELLQKGYTEFIAATGQQNIDSTFRDYRANLILELMGELKQALNNKGKRLILSPGGDPNWSKKQWLLDWGTAVDTKKVDEIIMQAYRYDHPGFVALLKRPDVVEYSKKVPFSVAVLMGLRVNTKSSGELIYQQTKTALEQNFGVSYFYYDTIDTFASERETAAERLKWHKKTTDLLRN